MIFPKFTKVMIYKCFVKTFNKIYNLPPSNPPAFKTIFHYFKHIVCNFIIKTEIFLLNLRLINKKTNKSIKKITCRIEIKNSS